MMKLSHRFAAAAWLGIALSTVWAQTFPSKPITIIMPYPVGGVLDIHTRLLAEIVSKDLGQPLVIVNQPGGGGTAGVASLVQRAPDGYTLAVIGETQFRLPHLQKLAYDPKTDLSYIANLADFQYGLSVAQNAPWKTIKELLNDAKANPGQISFGSSRGSAGHVAILQLEAAADVKFNYIPFNGAAAAHEAAAAGHVNAAIDAGYSGFVEGGRSRLLATLGENRITKYESVPTLKELGYHIVPTSSFGLVGPKGIDPKIVAVLDEAFRKALEQASYRQLVARTATSVRYMDHATYTQYAMQRVDKEKEVVKRLGLTVD